MASERFVRRRPWLVVVASLACACASAGRFPLKAPLVKDDDQRPFAHCHKVKLRQQQIVAQWHGERHLWTAHLWHAL